MPINLSNLDYLLETEYSSLGRKIKDYEAEYKRILEARKKEYKNTRKLFWIIGPRLWNEKDYPYFDELAAKQVFYIDKGKKGEVGIRTEEFSLPVTDSTETEKIEIYSSAKIPCDCWEGVRKKIAENYNLNVGDNEFYANVDSIFGGVIRKIIDVKKAKERLEAGIQRDFNSRLELTKI